MPVFLLDKSLWFPEIELADESGIVAVGGDLLPNRLLLAYKKGIFPWYSEDDPIVWHSPDPRFVLFPQDLKVSKSMKQVMRSGKFQIKVNTAFKEVIQACCTIKRNGQDGTWITDDMLEAYIQLHQLGYAHSVECWEGDELAGGLYGVNIGSCFMGESMFAHKSNASKAAFIHLVQAYNFSFIDCQVYTDHLASLGAEDIPRSHFKRSLLSAIEDDPVLSVHIKHKSL